MLREKPNISAETSDQTDVWAGFFVDFTKGIG